MNPRERSPGASMLLGLGAAAGPLYIVLGLLQVLTREGFDPRHHALSLLSNGDGGWIQVANFMLAGLLVVLGAIGCRKALRSQRGGTWGPVLLGLYGLGLVSSGIFPADPAQGFPPGSMAPAALSRAGLLHFVSGGIAFYSLIAASFVFARRFFGTGRKGLAWYSIATGTGFFLAFAAIASGSRSATVSVAFYIAVAWAWGWLTIVFVHLNRITTS